jgi:hypothetical protein
VILVSIKVPAARLDATGSIDAKRVRGSYNSHSGQILQPVDDAIYIRLIALMFSSRYPTEDSVVPASGNPIERVVDIEPELLGHLRDYIDAFPFP